MSAAAARPAGVDASPFGVRSADGPIEAHVVRAGARPSLHGYDVHRDLARSTGSGEVAMLALSGELLDDASGRAAEIALTFCAVVSIAEAPVHAAVLTRRCGSPVANGISVAASALAEQARAELDDHAALVAWLEGGTGRVPAAFAAASTDDRTAVDDLRAALGDVGRADLVPAGSITLAAARLAVLFRLGLRDRDRLQAALVVARLPIALGEALAAPRDLRGYPGNLPRFRYVEGEDAGDGDEQAS